MLMDSAFGDLWLPLSVFVILAVTLGIGLSRLLRCAACPCQSASCLAFGHKGRASRELVGSCFSGGCALSLAACTLTMGCCVPVCLHGD